MAIYDRWMRHWQPAKAVCYIPMSIIIIIIIIIIIRPIIISVLLGEENKFLLLSRDYYVVLYSFRIQNNSCFWHFLLIELGWQYPLI